MPRRKKSSSLVIAVGLKRAAGMKSIDPALDLGNGLTLASFEASLADVQSKLNAYNTLLSQAGSAP